MSPLSHTLKREASPASFLLHFPRPAIARAHCTSYNEVQKVPSVFHWLICQMYLVVCLVRSGSTNCYQEDFTVYWSFTVIHLELILVGNGQESLRFLVDTASKAFYYSYLPHTKFCVFFRKQCDFFQASKTHSMPVKCLHLLRNQFTWQVQAN